MTNEEFKAGIDAIKGGTGHKFDDPNEVKAWFAVVGKCDGRSWKAAVMRCLISDQGAFLHLADFANTSTNSKTGSSKVTMKPSRM